VDAAAAVPLFIFKCVYWFFSYIASRPFITHSALLLLPSFFHFNYAVIVVVVVVVHIYFALSSLLFFSNCPMYIVFYINILESSLKPLRDWRETD
jgi:hypothetical protein